MPGTFSRPTPSRCSKRWGCANISRRSARTVFAPWSRVSTPTRGPRWRRRPERRRDLRRRRPRPCSGVLATLLQRVAAGGDGGLLAPAIIARAQATALTGLLMFVLGFTHAGRAIRFLPYPVIGGFLGATGWLMVTGAIQVVTDQHATFANL